MWRLCGWRALHGGETSMVQEQYTVQHHLSQRQAFQPYCLFMCRGLMTARFSGLFLMDVVHAIISSCPWVKRLNTTPGGSSIWHLAAFLNAGFLLGESALHAARIYAHSPRLISAWLCCLSLLRSSLLGDAVPLSSGHPCLPLLPCCKTGPASQIRYER